jgi:release factor glutamine methyltransferase
MSRQSYLPANLPRAVAWDPPRALDGGADGLAAYRTLAAAVPALLAPGGIFACGIGWRQAASVTAILAAGGLTVEAPVRDLAGIERVLVASSSEAAPPARKISPEERCA